MFEIAKCLFLDGDTASSLSYRTLYIQKGPVPIRPVSRPLLISFKLCVIKVVNL